MKGDYPMENDTESGRIVRTAEKRPVVLVVDDDEGIADTYALWLNDEFDVRTAYGGREALETIGEEVDVVLLDRRMPAVPGDEVLEEIRDRDFDCLVSMLTAVEPDANLADLDFDEYLVKPVTKAEVVGVVEELLLRGTFDEGAQDYLALESTIDTITDYVDEDDDGTVESLTRQAADVGEAATVDEQVAQFDRLKDIHNLMRSVNQIVVDADSRDSLERKICQRFVDVDPYVYAVSGEYSPSHSRFTPRATSDGVELEPVVCESGDPIRSSVEADEVRVVDAETWEESVQSLVESIPHDVDADSVVLIPTTYRDANYSLMVLVADEPTEFDERERETLLELGRTVGNAFESLQTRELVHADTVVELELQVTDPGDVFVGLSTEYGCRVRLEGINFSSEEGIVCYLTVSSHTSDDVTAFLVGYDGVDTCRVIDERDDEMLVEVTLTDNSIALKLLDVGGNVKSFFVEDGTGHVVLELPPDADVRSTLESVQREFDSVDLLSKRNTERSFESVESFRSVLAKDFTERQEAVIEAAYNAGYFEWPRESTAEEVADGLGMAAPTFHEHLREAERKLVETYLDERN